MKELLELQKNAAKRSKKTAAKHRHSLLLAVIILAFVGVIAIGCVVNYTQAANNRHKTDEISQQIEQVESENKELERFLKEENNDEYYEKIAREEYGYAKPGERVFYDSSFSNKK